MGGTQTEIDTPTAYDVLDWPLTVTAQDGSVTSFVYQGRHDQPDQHQAGDRALTV